MWGLRVKLVTSVLLAHILLIGTAQGAGVIGMEAPQPLGESASYTESELENAAPIEVPKAVVPSGAATTAE